MTMIDIQRLAAFNQLSQAAYIRNPLERGAGHIIFYEHTFK
jgi:hypothetical protein